MKTLILSCNTGGGHNSSANGVREYFESKNESVEVVDALSFVSVKFSNFISKAHSFLYKYTPNLNSALHTLAQKTEKKFTDNFLGYKMLSKGVNSLARKVIDGEFDTVICVHIFSVYMLTKAIKKYNLKVKTAFINTDYSFTPGLQRSNFDAYFIPHPLLIGEFVSGGVNEDKIIACGIPVKQSFTKVENKNYAKSVYNINCDLKHVVISAGSIGCGPIKKVAVKLSKSDMQVFITVVCGNNVKLKKSLQKVAKKCKNLRVRGYVNDMPLLLSSADVYVTKAGGLSVTEALIKQVPMVIVNTVNGCEKGNVNFFVKGGMASVTKTANGAYSKCVEYLTNAVSYNDKLRCLETCKIGNASEAIYNFFKKVI